MKKTVGDIAVLLHDIRSVHNVGSIFRTADAFGVSLVYLSGYTPLPVDQFQRPRKDMIKVSLGAENSVKWKHVADPKKLISSFKKKSWRIVGVEQSPDSINYYDLSLDKKPTLILVGNEVGGISPDLLKLCNTIIEIPMSGKKESLNVSVAFGVALSRIVH